MSMYKEALTLLKYFTLLNYKNAHYKNIPHSLKGVGLAKHNQRIQDIILIMKTQSMRKQAVVGGKKKKNHSGDRITNNKDQNNTVPEGRCR